MAATESKKDSDFESLLYHFCRALKDLSTMLDFTKLNIANYSNKTNIKALYTKFNAKISPEL